MDYSKAFDTINHNLLCFKLKYFDFSENSIHLIHSYLSNRSHKVLLNNEFSTLQNVKSGVPQGSILGPMLFILYTSDILTSVRNCKIQAYADHTQLYYNIDSNNYQVAEQALNKDLDLIHKLSIKHNVKLNKNKCHLILFGNKKQRNCLSQSLSIKND